MAIVVLGAGITLPFAVPQPRSTTGDVPVDLAIWPIVVIVLVLTGNHEWVALRRDPLARLLLAFMIVGALSIPIGVMAFHNSAGVRSYVYGVGIISNFAAGYLILRDIDDLEIFMRAFVGSIGVISIGLNGYLLSQGILRSVHEFHNSHFFSALVYGWPNAFSVVLAVALIMAIHVIVAAGSTWVRRAYVVLAISLGACLILTFSKTGWAALALASWFLFLRTWSWKRQLTLIAVIAVLGVILYFLSNNSFRTQVFTIETLTERLVIVVDVFRYTDPLYLIIGSGSQSLETLLAGHADVTIAPTVSLATLSPHDEFMNVLVKGGIGSLILFVIAIVVVMLRSRALAGSSALTVAMFFRYWYGAAWAVVISMFAGEELRYWPIAALFWLIAGAMIHFVSDPGPERLGEAEPARRPATARDAGTTPVG